tara:strand:- start:56 stop:466 length:411 start_codon:yes stop_codon:yes gene_type:complete
METNMQTPKLRPKNLKKKKKKGGAPANSPMPKPRPAGLGATKKEMETMDRGFRIQEMEGREREVMKKGSGGKLKMVRNKNGEMVPDYAADGVGKMAYGGKVKKMAYGGKVKKMGSGGSMCRGMGKATQGGNYSKMG